MNYPAGLPTREVSFGQAFSIVGGVLLAMRVTIEASRDLVHLPTGSPLIAVETFFLSGEVSGNRVIPLPVTDSTQMGLPSTGDPVVLGAGESTHYYSAKIEYLDADTQRVLPGVAARRVGLFLLPTGDGSTVDLDALYAPLTPTVPITPTLLEQFQAVREQTLTARDQAVAARDQAVAALASYPTNTQMTSAISTASTSDRQRGNHTGTQTSATIADFIEAVQDVVGGMMVSGGNLTFTYDDATGKVTGTATGVDAEATRDILGVALVGVNGVSIVPNDAADTIVVGLSGVTISQITGLQAALNLKADASLLSPVATSGEAGDLVGLSLVGESGQYNDLIGRPERLEQVVPYYNGAYAATDPSALYHFFKGPVTPTVGLGAAREGDLWTKTTAAFPPPVGD